VLFLLVAFRDDQIHGTQNGEDLMVYNAPEVATFENLWPGIYRVYVNAYPPDGESPVFTSQVGFAFSILLNQVESALFLLPSK
jgi:hypothetical protein